MKVIEIKGAITMNDYKEVYKSRNRACFAPEDLILPENGEDIEVHINSGGGMVFAGSEIYTALKSYSGKVTVKIVGMAASAASVIAMAGDEVQISPTAQLMIHNASSMANGDYNALHAQADVAKNINTSIANAYVLKTGKSLEELLDLMNQTTYFTAQQAVEAGFADKIMFHDEQVSDYVASMEDVIPDSIIAELYEKDTNSTDVLLKQIMGRLDDMEQRLDSKPVGEMPVKVTIDTKELVDALKEAQHNPMDDSPFGKFFNTK